MKNYRRVVKIAKEVDSERVDNSVRDEQRSVDPNRFTSGCFIAGFYCRGG